ncbi:MAG: GatB/YqeY domain-containing protein [Patescibacteria group bacterium]|nr:GatB/YqeY domain-containing protein [Patescibacteria group bacterium]
MLKQKLQQDQINALKTGQKEKLAVIRYVLAKIKNKEIEKQSQLNDEETIAVMRKILKELEETLVAAKNNQRQELVEKTNQEIEIISSYLPQELSDEQLKEEVEKIIKTNQEIYQKNPKAIIGLCVKALKTKANPQRIIKILGL